MQYYNRFEGQKKLTSYVIFYSNDQNYWTIYRKIQRYLYG